MQINLKNGDKELKPASFLSIITQQKAGQIEANDLVDSRPTSFNRLREENALLPKISEDQFSTSFKKPQRKVGSIKVVISSKKLKQNNQKRSSSPQPSQLYAPSFKRLRMVSNASKRSLSKKSDLDSMESAQNPLSQSQEILNQDISVIERRRL